MRVWLFAFLLLPAGVLAQPSLNYDKPFVCTSQLGFRTGSEKWVTLFPGTEGQKLPAEIPFFIQPIGNRQVRVQAIPPEWNVPGNVFRYPIGISEGKFAANATDPKSFSGGAAYTGVLRRMDTPWGRMWRGDFSGFEKNGFYQIETEYGFTVPFVVEENPYQRFERGYLEFMFSQRSGVEVPGVRPVENADDARLDSDESVYLPVAGGWNDAGDHRKWLFLTLPNLEALAQIVRYGHPAFREQALDEMRWGNAYFHHMITDEGRVYEDVGAGKHRGANYDLDWWNENHPGVTASGDMGVDNIPMNGNERHLRDKYNPLVQFQFVRYQSIAAQVLTAGESNNCLVLADKAWRYSQGRVHDQRTIFIAEELLAALELKAAGSTRVPPARIAELAEALVARQETREAALSGYFMEKDATDGYRSIAFSAEPALALLRLAELAPAGLEALTARAREAARRYARDFLLKGAADNPFRLTPYGVYVDPPYPKAQVFRDAGLGRSWRTFIHLFSPRPMPHGVGAVHLAHAYFLSRASRLLGEAAWAHQAEKTLQWYTGHNTAGLSLHTSVGFRHVVPANFVNYRVPESAVVGFLGYPNDLPYVETSHAIEWSTQEAWDVPYFYTIGIVAWLTQK